MPYTRQDVQGMENDTLMQRFRILVATAAANDAVNQNTPQEIRTNVSMLEHEIRDRMNDGLNARRVSQHEYNFPVWATQGGGLARRVGDKLIFVTDSNCPGLTIGMIVPDEWDIQPANDLARQKASEHEFGRPEETM